jgi:hypothetical protein
MRNVFAVCDTEQEYAIRLMEYLNCRRNMPFEIQMFTSPEALVEFAGKRHIDLLLVSERAATDDILDLPVGKLVVLAEGEMPGKLDSYPSVCKYQSADEVVREVMDFYSAELEATQPAKIMKPDVRRIGVISTWEPALRTAYAIAMGEVLAENRKVLYASLDPWSGTAPAFGDNADRTMSELLYYYRQGKHGLIYCADSLIRSFHGMNYIPPSKHPGDLLLMDAGQWCGLFDELMQTGTYDTLILDLGCRMADPEGVLSSCDEIYLPVSDDLFAQKAVDTWLLWAEESHAEWTGRVQTIPVDSPTAENVRHLFETGGVGGSGGESGGDFFDGRILLEALCRSKIGHLIRTQEENRRQKRSEEVYGLWKTTEKEDQTVPEMVADTETVS